MDRHTAPSIPNSCQKGVGKRQLSAGVVEDAKTNPGIFRAAADVPVAVTAKGDREVGGGGPNGKGVADVDGAGAGAAGAGASCLGLSALDLGGGSR